MPGLDSTGPKGQGARTGRHLGRCKPPPDSDKAKNNIEATGDKPGFDMDPDRGLSRGYGRGPGHRFGRGTGRETCRGPGRGMGRGMGRNRGNW